MKRNGKVLNKSCVRLSKKSIEGIVGGLAYRELDVSKYVKKFRAVHHNFLGFLIQLNLFPILLLRRPTEAAGIIKALVDTEYRDQEYAEVMLRNRSQAYDIVLRKLGANMDDTLKTLVRKSQEHSERLAKEKPWLCEGDDDDEETKKSNEDGPIQSGT